MCKPKDKKSIVVRFWDKKNQMQAQWMESLVESFFALLLVADVTLHEL